MHVYIYQALPLPAFIRCGLHAAMSLLGAGLSRLQRNRGEREYSTVNAEVGESRPAKQQDNVLFNKYKLSLNLFATDS